MYPLFLSGEIDVASRAAVIDKELDQLNIDITSIQETKLRKHQEIHFCGKKIIQVDPGYTVLVFITKASAYL